MADQSALSSRAIIGTYYRLLEQDTGIAWVDQISNLFGSDQASEEYKFLGMAPAMREWVGGRQVKSLNTNGITLTNVHYEATIEMRVRDMRRDKTSQMQAQVSDLVQHQQAHWGSLVSTLIQNGETGVCYDGQFFFDTDHVEGANTTNQSNNISVTIANIPSQVAGTITSPSNEQIQGVILKAITQMLGFVDDQGEPMNEMASEFVVMTAPSLWPAAVAATNLITTGAMVQNVNPNTLPGMTVRPVMNTRLTGTSKVYVFRADSAVKPFIRQNEMDSVLKSRAEGSEYEFENDAWQFGIDSWRAAGYGYWQHAVLATMI